MRRNRGHRSQVAVNSQKSMFLTNCIFLILCMIVFTFSIAHAQTTSYDLVLKKGANLVSIPIVPGDQTIEGLFGEKLDKVTSIKYYDPENKEWLSYQPDAPDNTLEMIPEGAAFYTEAKEDVTVDIIGTAKNFLDTSLYAGWNLIGVAKEITPKGFAENNKQFMYDYDTVYTFDEKGNFVALAADDKIIPGKGYWLDNDPDNDGVSSRDEIAHYGSSPKLNDLVVKDGKVTKKGEVDTGAKTNEEKIASLQDECGQTYDPASGKSLDEMYDKCKREKKNVNKANADLSKEYPIAGNDVTLGGFTITQVRYKEDSSGKKVAGIGIIEYSKFPEKLKGLFTVEGGAMNVFLDLRDEKVSRAIAESLKGITLGRGSDSLSIGFGTSDSEFDYLDIDQQGTLELGFTAKVLDLPKRTYFVRWDPEREKDKPVDKKDKLNFIQMGLLLGDDPSEELTASRVWQKGPLGDVELRSREGHEWFVNFPRMAESVFETYVDYGRLGERKIGHSDSPLDWLPASSKVDSKEITFTSDVASKLVILSGLIPGDLIAIPTENLEGLMVDERGRIKTGNKVFQYRDGSLVISDPSETIQGLFRGWEYAPGLKDVAYKIVLNWKPSFTLNFSLEDLIEVFAGKEIQSIKDAYFSIAIEPEVVFRVLKDASIKNDFKELFTKFKERRTLSGLKIEGKAKVSLDFDGKKVEFFVNPKILQQELFQESDKRTWQVTMPVEWKLFYDMEGFGIGGRIKGGSGFISDKGLKDLLTGEEGERRAIFSQEDFEFTVRVRMPDKWPLIGGEDAFLHRWIRREYNRPAPEGQGGIFKEQDFVILNLVEGQKTKDLEDGWRLVLDEIRFEFPTEEDESKTTSVLMPTCLGKKEFMGTSKSPIPEVKGLKFNTLVTVLPPNDWEFGGPYEAMIIGEHITDDKTSTDYWKIFATADLNLKIDIDDKNYIVIKELIFTKEGTQSWLFGAVAEFYFDGHLIAGNLLFQKGGFIFMAKGMNLGPFNSIDLLLSLSKDSEGKKKWAMSLGGVLNKEIFPDWQDMREKVGEGLAFSGQYIDGNLVLQLGNLPIPIPDIPDWVEFEKFRNVVYRKLKDGGWDIAVDLDMIVKKIIDESKPRAEWPRLTAGLTYSTTQGVFISGKNIGPIPLGDGGKLTFVEIGGGSGQAGWRFVGKVNWEPSEGTIDAIRSVVVLPNKIGMDFQMDSSGWFASMKWDKPLELSFAGNMKVLANGIVLKKQSPWSFSIDSALRVDDKSYPGSIGYGAQGMEFSVPGDVAVSFELPGGFKVSIKNFRIALGAILALAGDVTVNIPEGNAARGFIGEQFTATISGSPAEFIISTPTNIKGDMNMGPLGMASFNLDRLSISSLGNFSINGQMTIDNKLARKTVRLTAGIRGTSVYFLADFGDEGIQAKLAHIFDAEIKRRLGFETLLGLQYVRVDDMRLFSGVEVGGTRLFGFEYKAQGLLYFLPSSIPPVGFAFFDSAEGITYTYGFGVNVGLKFPAPEAKDFLTAVQVLIDVFRGGEVNWTKLGDMKAPAFGIHNVYIQLPIVPGYGWDRAAKTLKYTDNVFGAMFGSDKLNLPGDLTLGPKKMVEIATADSVLDVIKAVIPEDKRKGSASVNIRGFDAGIKYDLRDEKILYEEKKVDKLPELYHFVKKVRYVDEKAGPVPGELMEGEGTDIIGQWNGNDKAFKHKIGKAEGEAWTARKEDGSDHMLFGPYMPLKKGDYRAVIEVRSSDNTSKTTIMGLDIAVNGARDIPVSQGYNGSDFRFAQQYQKFYIDFSLKEDVKDFQIRIATAAKADISVKSIKLSKAGRSKTDEITIPSELGGGTAKVKWQVVDINEEIKEITGLLSEITPDEKTPWEKHFEFIWDQLVKKSGQPVFEGNRAKFPYSSGMLAELEVREHEGSYDVTGLAIKNNALSGKFGTVTLYQGTDYQGQSKTMTDDTPAPPFKPSSVKIEGRGKVTLSGSHRVRTGEIKSVEITENKGNLDATDVKDIIVPSVRVFYPLNLSDVTNWRLTTKSDSGIVMTLDSGGIEVSFPGNARLLTILPGSRMKEAVEDIKKVFNELRPYPAIKNNASNYLLNLWNNQMLPLKEDAEVKGITVGFPKYKDSAKTKMDSKISFSPIKYSPDGSITGIKFDKKNGVLSARMGKVTLFEHVNFVGNFFEVSDDTGDMGYTPLGNDIASSIKIEGGGRATLYADTDFKETWYYDTMVTAKHSGKCLDVPCSSMDKDVTVWQWDCNQQWRLKPKKDDYYEVVAKHSGKCLDVYAFNRDNEARLVQWDCNGLDNQAWKLIPKGGGYYSLAAKHSGKCLDVFAFNRDNGAKILQWDCNDKDNQLWRIDTNKIYPTTTLEKSAGWLGDYPIGNDALKSIKVYHPLDINNTTEWAVSRSIPAQGAVHIGNRKNEKGSYEPYYTGELSGSSNKFYISYDDSGSLFIKPMTERGYEFPAANYRIFVKGDIIDTENVHDVSKYVKIITKTYTMPDGTTVRVNQEGGITATYEGISISSMEIGSDRSSFVLSAPDDVKLEFAITKGGGFSSATVVGSSPVIIVPIYTDDSGVPQGYKEIVKKIEGGFFADAHLRAGASDIVKLDLQVSGSIKTDGNFYFKGNGDLVIANYTVSEAVVELSSEKGLYIKGKMDLFNVAKADIEGYLRPDGEFSFTGVAQIMVSGTGIKGSLAFSNSGLTIFGGAYIANTLISSQAFEIKEGRVRWKNRMGVGFAGIDATIWIQFKAPQGAGLDGNAYLDADVPVLIFGPTSWDCTRIFGIRICWPTRWGWIRVGVVRAHFTQGISAGLTGSTISFGVGPGKLNVNVAKPSLSVSW